jgi:DNA-binding SARP family transcriptional activator
MAAVAVRRLFDGPNNDLIPGVAIQSLGVFAVWRGDEVVPTGEWQSRKARDLLKILVSRRGRPITRDGLIETLWPQQDPGKTSNRLSVALSTVRAVLDPERCFEAGRFLRADRYAVRLERDNLTIDVEAFFEYARTGLAFQRPGREEEAVESLEQAEAAYTGDFLEEDLYEDWAVSLREEARAVYVAVANALAERAAGVCDHEGAVRFRLRTLEFDPYDERAHLGLVAALVAAGRYGDAHRSYRRFAARMAEISVEPPPFFCAR